MRLPPVRPPPLACHPDPQCQADAADSRGPVASNEPTTVRLADGTRFPMLGLGTAGIKDASAIK